MKAKKSLGQHWLNDSASLQTITKVAELKPADTVLEIGPGQGSLTELLAQNCQKVIAVEADGELLPILSAKFSTSQNIKIVYSDILNFDLSSLPKSYKVVANIPYYLTGKILRILVDSDNLASNMVFLVQKEVAQRITAGAGHMSVLAVCIQFLYQANFIKVVSKDLFLPPPKVDSAIIQLKKLTQPAFKANQKKFFRLVKIGFSQRRKTLKNNLSAAFRINSADTQSLLVKSKINPQARAQELEFSDWQKLYDNLVLEGMI